MVRSICRAGYRSFRDCGRRFGVRLGGHGRLADGRRRQEYHLPLYGHDIVACQHGRVSRGNSAFLVEIDVAWRYFVLSCLCRLGNDLMFSRCIWDLRKKICYW
jgi:hypothetical protein